MTHEPLVVPLRVRVTQRERDRYQEAMDRLGVVEFSLFVRWALENSVTQVLGPPAKPEKSVRKPKTASPVLPPPRERPTLSVVPSPLAQVAPAMAPPPTLLGIPLYASPSDPRPAPIEDDDWT